MEASDEAQGDIRNRLPKNGFNTINSHRRRPQPLRSPGEMTIIAAIALTAGLTALAALAAFGYFGAYWRMVWRQNRRGEATTLSLDAPIRWRWLEGRDGEMPCRGGRMRFL